MFEDKCKQIDRSKFNVIEYATEILNFISDENDQHIPTLEQLQYLQQTIFRFYWTPNQQTTWIQILDIIEKKFIHSIYLI